MKLIEKFRERARIAMLGSEKRFTIDEIMQASDKADIPRKDSNKLISYLIEKK